MKDKIKKAKGFIQTTLLIGIIISLIAIVGYGIFKNHIATTSSIVTVEEFMKARIEKNMEKASSFLTDNAKMQYSSGKLTLVGVSNPHFADFKILETKKLNATQFRFKVRIDEEYTGQGKVGYFDETLTVIKKEDRYLIDSVERGEYTNTFTPTTSQTTDNFKKYSNSLLGIEFYYPKNFIPYLRDNEYICDQPARFTSGKDSYAPLDENSTFVIGLAGIKEGNQTIDQVAENSAYHKLRPFGENPIINKLEIEGQEARLIIPSDPSNNERELIVRLKNPVLVGNSYWTFLVIHTSRDLGGETMKVISESFTFVKKTNHGPHPYFNNIYGFTLMSDPNQSNPYTDYPDLYSFQVIPITKNCGDITSTCPPASIIPGFREDEGKRPPLRLKKITFPGNPVPFCFVKGIPEYGAGSIYESYYYITTTKDNRCFAMHFVVHKANCKMFGIKEQIDKCTQDEERKDQIPDEYVKTFRFVDPVHIYELKLTDCKAIPNNSTQKIVETTRLFINLPKDIYPDEEHNLKFSTVSGNARASRLDNCGSPGTGCQSTSECWSYYCQFDGNGEVDLHVKSAIKGMPDYFVRFIVSSTPN